MKIFISLLNVPIGYTRPSFPSLYWPLGPEKSKFQASYLYYSGDMWHWIVWWSLILFGVLYFITGMLAVIIQIRDRYRYSKLDKMTFIGAIIIVLVYTAIGLFQGFVGGAIIGLMVSSVYRTGVLSMSTWIPFCWAIAMVLFDVCNSYSLSSVIL